MIRKQLKIFNEGRGRLNERPKKSENAQAGVPRSIEERGENDQNEQGWNL
jgi:hypothetical protein